MSDMARDRSSSAIFHDDFAFQQPNEDGIGKPGILTLHGWDTSPFLWGQQKRGYKVGWTKTVARGRFDITVSQPQQAASVVHNHQLCAACNDIIVYFACSLRFLAWS